MTTQEKISQINQINQKYEQNYKLNKQGRIYSTFMGKKQWYKFDELIQKWNDFELEMNSRNNVKIVREFIENNGGELITRSMTNSHYYIFKNKKVIISDHDWTSDKYFEPDVNLCSYKENGHIELILILKSL